jgi:predicted nucleotidyltransferase
MHHLLVNNLSKIQNLCRKYSVQSLFAFGSVLTADFSPSSDIDLLVTFTPSSSSGAFSRFFGFKDALENLFKRPVDLVSSRAIANPHFKQQIESTKAALYAA